jgi:hypothetical protein
MKTSMVKQGGTLVADNQQAVEILSRIPDNRLVMVDIKQSRNIQNHRRFYSFLTDVFHMQDHFVSVEALRFWLIMKAGYIESFSAPNGHVMYKPQSMSFATMDEVTFKGVFSNCIDVVLREFNLDRDALNQVVDYA